MENKDTVSGRIVLVDRVIESGVIVMDAGKIAEIKETESGTHNSWIIPGFIDVHVHGLAYGDASTREGVIEMARFAPSAGMTSFCPTIGNVEIENYFAYLSDINELMNNPPDNSAKVLGTHFEGPYIVVSHRGGMAERLLRVPCESEVKHILELAKGSLKIMTLSPEIEGADWLIPMLRKNGCVVSAGHTGCSPVFFKETAVPLGVEHVCHLFDTFTAPEVARGVTAPRLVDEIMINDNVTVELIPDGIHVPSTMLELAKRALGSERFVAITDGMWGAGLPDGEYVMPDGRKYRTRKGDVCRLVENDDIVGSGMTMAQVFHNLVSRFGFTPSEASLATSTNPARLLGEGDSLGRLDTGMIADMTEINEDGEIIATWINGEKVYER